MVRDPVRSTAETKAVRDPPQAIAKGRYRYVPIMEEVGYIWGGNSPFLTGFFTVDKNFTHR
jgi:hypothetical protein